jgi:hypothetical protein
LKEEVMRRLFLSLAAGLPVLCGLVAVGATSAPAAASSRCLSGQIVRVSASFRPQILRPGQTGKGYIVLTNCTRTIKRVKYSGAVTSPSRCGSRRVPFGPLKATLGPRKTVREKPARFPAPPCAGDFRQLVNVYVGTKLVAQTTASFIVR